MHHSFNGQPIGTTINGEFVLAVSDHLGSASVNRQAGGETSVQQYTPFGVVRGATGELLNDWSFAGQTDDPGAGLIDYSARHYDPQLGRFVMADTVLDGLNRYGYVRNNPLRYVDPTGHCIGFLPCPDPWEVIVDVAVKGGEVIQEEVIDPVVDKAKEFEVGVDAMICPVAFCLSGRVGTEGAWFEPAPAAAIAAGVWPTIKKKADEPLESGWNSDYSNQFFGWLGPVGAEWTFEDDLFDGVLAGTGYGGGREAISTARFPRPGVGYGLGYKHSFGRLELTWGSLADAADWGWESARDGVGRAVGFGESVYEKVAFG